MSARRRLSRLFLAGLAATLAVACSQASEEESSDDLSGKDLKSYWADYKKLDLGDLTRATTTLATPVLNDRLAFGGFAAAIDAPTAYAASAQPNRILPGDAQVHALDTIVSGLAARFGEKELGTEVNRARLDFLNAGGAEYFIEAGFSIKAGFDWSSNGQGLANGAGVSLGFELGAEIQTRVIVASTDNNVGAYLQAPLKAAREVRGFVLPESLDHVQAMKPGEMFALRGLGHVGGNFAVGVPITAAEPTAGAIYRIVLSGGVATVIGGQVDVQLVRLPGDEVVVDVGVEHATSVKVSAAVTDGFGIKGICDDGIKCLREVSLGPAKVDLQQLVEKTIDRQLNKHLSFSASADRGKTTDRIGVSRMRFHLDRGNRDEVEAALKQALKLDTRLAFALYNRSLGEPNSPVDVEFDAVRAATTTRTNFGFEVLGMNLYQRNVVDTKGSFTVETPDGARAILFDSLYKHNTLFQTQHAFTRTGVSALTAGREGTTTEANLFLQAVVSDAHMDNDLIIDNADAILAALAPKAVEALDAAGTEMQNAVRQACTPKPPERGQTGPTVPADCNTKLLAGPRFIELKQRALAAAALQFASLPQDFRDLAYAAANVRLALQSVETSSLLGGPQVSFSVDCRFDDKALGILMSKTAEEYRTALKNFVGAVRVDRSEALSRSQIDAVTEEKWGSEMDKMTATFKARTAIYRDIAEVEKQLPRALAGKAFIPSPLGIRLPVTRDEGTIYLESTILSLADDRSHAAVGLIDDLKSAGGELHVDLYKEQLAALPLMALVPAKNLELATDLMVDTSGGLFQNPERFIKAGFKSEKHVAKGSEVSTISAGMFDLHAIVGP